MSNFRVLKRVSSLVKIVTKGELVASPEFYNGGGTKPPRLKQQVPPECNREALCQSDHANTLR
ncbi:hypothetical protein PROFUN_01123 [Planoprotostelium fungivorum]|uniref:Uncharacterized protein n=1 Tax=Planoprotostelium fungivorum TaxID=1890364 RepID=A0A2P6NCC4_9EUKA|nr:hypothetical protein PROFUN_01123 [Planoprotostelium fungivorum]